MLFKNSNIDVYWFENGASNVTIFETDDRLIAFDSSLYPKKFEEIVNISESKYNKPLTDVFITHYHPDHCFGVLNYTKKINIILSRKTLYSLLALKPEYIKNISKESNYYFSKPKDILDNFNIEIFEETIYKKYGNTVITGQNVGGHTEDSTIYFIKPYNYLVCGDLVFSEVHTEFIDYNIDSWIKILEIISKNKNNIIIPGHGIPGENDIINNQIFYLNSFKENKNMINLFPDYIIPEYIKSIQKNH